MVQEDSPNLIKKKKKCQQIEIIGFRFELRCKLGLFFGLFMAFHQSLFGGFLGHELGGLMSQSGHTRSIKAATVKTRSLPSG